MSIMKNWKYSLFPSTFIIASLPTGISRIGYWLHYIDEAINEAMSAIAPGLYMKTYNNVENDFAPNLAQQNLQIEDNEWTD